MDKVYVSRLAPPLPPLGFALHLAPRPCGQPCLLGRSSPLAEPSFFLTNSPAPEIATALEL